MFPYLSLPRSATSDLYSNVAWLRFSPFRAHESNSSRFRNPKHQRGKVGVPTRVVRSLTPRVPTELKAQLQDISFGLRTNRPRRALGGASAKLIVYFMLVLLCVRVGAAAPLQVGFFDIDATPPVGSPLAYNIMDRHEASLRLKGVVLAGSGPPVVLVAVDWIGIGGAGHTRFREVVAEAVGTSPSRVAVHCLHQHDAPRFDLSAETLLAAEGLSGKMYNVGWVNQVLRQVADEARRAAANLAPATHIAWGQAAVEKVASNRRILGDDGKVLHTRYTATADPAVRAFPEGVIDRNLKAMVVYDGDRPLVVLTYYATHPQSYYRTGTAHPDFPGMAREQRQQESGIPHVHFNGAGGNIGAGKYNDGAPANRAVLANRVAQAMKAAFEAAAERVAVTADDLSWSVTQVNLPAADHLEEPQLAEILADPQADVAQRIAAAKALAFLRRCQAGVKTDISCLELGRTRVLHMPGELFVEYQLQAAKLRPDLFLMMAAYGDYAPGYIGTEISYSQGGYETSERASRVAPSVEGVLLSAIQELLEQP